MFRWGGTNAAWLLTSSPFPAILEDVSYPGGKAGAGVFQKIINLMPPHEVYIEPFLGGAAVMRLKRPARVNIGIDRDAAPLGSAIAYFGGASSRNSNLVGSPDLAISAALGRNGDWRSPLAGSGENRRRRSRESPETSMVDRPWCFLEGNALDFLRDYRFTGRELVYCDPPYLRSTRSSSKPLYRFEMPDREHQAFLRILRRLPCMVMVSGYWSRMYADALKGWHSTSFQAMTRGGRPATEWIWMNFPPPVELHDYRYLGSTFRERERIGRKQKRWAERLRKMPVLERQALLAAIAAAANVGTGDAADLASPNLPMAAGIAVSGDGVLR